MKPIATIAILFAVLICMWSAQAQHMTQQQYNASMKKPVPLCQEIVDQIKPGMSAEDVYEIVKATPYEVNQVQGKIRTDREKTILWYHGDDGKFLGVIMKSDSVDAVISNY